MNNFEFPTVPTLISQIGAAQQLGCIIKQHYPELKRLLIVTDAGFLKTGLIAPAIANMQQQCQVSIFSGVVAAVLMWPN